MLLNQENVHSLTDETIFAVTNRERNHSVHIASDQLKDARDRRLEDTVRFVLESDRLIRCV